MTAAANMVEVAALVGDTARATMLSALMGGRALTATELAFLARISRSTASEHLAKLVGARLISVTRKRRFSYYRITSPLVARMLESIKVIAAIEAPRRYQARSAQDAALRLARTCYDHLAGHLGVAIADTLSARGLIVLTDDGGLVTPGGEDFFRGFGIPLKQSPEPTHLLPPLPRLERAQISRGGVHWGAAAARLCRPRLARAPARHARYAHHTGRPKGICRNVRRHWPLCPSPATHSPGKIRRPFAVGG